MEGGVGRSFEASSLHPFSTLLLARARKMSDTQRLVEFVPHPFLSAALSEADGEGGDRHDGVHEAVLLRGGPPGHPIRAQWWSEWWVWLVGGMPVNDGSHNGFRTKANMSQVFNFNFFVFV